MASDDLKRYEPTSRKLARLRRAGEVATSPAVTAVAGLAAAGVAGAVLGPGLIRGLGGMLAQDLQLAGTMAPAPASLLAHLVRHLGLAAILTLAIAGGLGLVQTVAHLLQTGFAVRGGGEPGSPRVPWGGGGGRARGAPRAELGLGLGLGLLAAAVCGSGLLRELATAGSWEEMGPGPAWVSLGGRWLVGLAGLALLQLAAARARFQARAAMSHRELQDEARETSGPALTRRPDRQRTRNHG